MKRIRTNNPVSYWTVGYLIQYNEPCIGFSTHWETDTEVIHFMKEFAKERGVSHCWGTGHYIFRVHRGTYYARYRSDKNGKWIMMIPSVKIEIDKPLPITWIK